MEETEIQNTWIAPENFSEYFDDDCNINQLSNLEMRWQATNLLGR